VERSYVGFEHLDIEVLRRRQGKKWSTFDADVLPAWVADMDFPVAPPIRERLVELIGESDLGYPRDDHAARLAGLTADRCRERFQWTVDPARIELIADVVQGVRICLELFTRPGEGALILTPIYPPFLHATHSMGRRADCHTLTRFGNGFEIDWERLEADVGPDTRVVLLCNPHNPTGRVFTRSELTQLGELAVKHDWIVVSDEIHSDLVLDGHRHIPFASLDPELEARTVTLLSATKSFNIAGLRCATMIFGSEGLQQAYRDGPGKTRGAVSRLGVHATEAAWRECDPWLASLNRHLQENRNRIAAFLAERLPDIRFAPPQATYLAWLDCRALERGEALWRTILDEGRLAVNDGREFGPGGDECVRLNFATSTNILDEALRRLHRALSR